VHEISELLAVANGVRVARRPVRPVPETGACSYGAMEVIIATGGPATAPLREGQGHGARSRIMHRARLTSRDVTYDRRNSEGSGTSPPDSRQRRMPVQGKDLSTWVDRICSVSLD
jgi:hypothetical protein